MDGKFLRLVLSGREDALQQRYVDAYLYTCVYNCVYICMYVYMYIIMRTYAVGGLTLRLLLLSISHAVKRNVFMPGGAAQLAAKLQHELNNCAQTSSSHARLLVRDSFPWPYEQQFAATSARLKSRCPLDVPPHGAQQLSGTGRSRLPGLHQKTDPPVPIEVTLTGQSPQMLYIDAQHSGNGCGIRQTCPAWGKSCRTPLPFKTLRHPKYHLMETIRPLIEVHCGV